MDSASPAFSTRVRQLCQAGYTLLDQNQPDAALRQFYQAWTLIPLPQTDHEESGWVLTAIGDAYLGSQRYPLAIEALRSASCCHKATENPVIRLKLGQALYEDGDTAQAALELTRALRLGGEKIFNGQAAKYLTLAKLSNRQV
ncbi:MAG TPA: tetratricopeptide repeat protein [Pseudomonadales bacterium]